MPHKREGIPDRGNDMYMGTEVRESAVHLGNCVLCGRDGTLVSGGDKNH